MVYESGVMVYESEVMGVRGSRMMGQEKSWGDENARVLAGKE